MIYLLVLTAIQINNYLIDDVAGFKIRIPCPYEEKYQNISTDVGEVAVFTYVFKPEEKDPENDLYLLNYIEYPENLTSLDSLDFIESIFAESLNTTP